MARRGKRAPQRPNTQAPRQPPPPPPTPSRSAIRHRLGAAAAFVVALVGLTASIDAIWGPIWPTVPDIHPGPPDPVSPFAVPFTIKNRSVVFKVWGASITCLIDSMTMKGNNTMTNASVGIADMVELEPAETRPFSCKISVPFNYVEQAVMRIRVEYQINFICGCVLRHTIGPYSWNGRAWSEGKPL
jgi:hypothetical protein